MSVTLELTPELEAAATAWAAARGMPVAVYLRVLLEQVILPHPHSPQLLTSAEFEAAADAFSADTEHLPILSDEELTRESIYGEHD